MRKTIDKVAYYSYKILRRAKRNRVREIRSQDKNHHPSLTSTSLANEKRSIKASNASIVRFKKWLANSQSELESSCHPVRDKLSTLLSSIECIAGTLSEICSTRVLKKLRTSFGASRWSMTSWKDTRWTLNKRCAERWLNSMKVPR